MRELAAQSRMREDEDAPIAATARSTPCNLEGKAFVLTPDHVDMSQTYMNHHERLYPRATRLRGCPDDLRSKTKVCMSSHCRIVAPT